MSVSEFRHRMAVAARRGMASLADPSVVQTPSTFWQNGFAKDAKALSGDWKAVGNDLRQAVEKETEGRKIPAVGE